MKAVDEFIALRGELATVSTPEEAINVRDKADKIRRAFLLMNKSVEECNKFGEIYLQATWKFGDLIKDAPEGAPVGNQNAKRK